MAKWADLPEEKRGHPWVNLHDLHRLAHLQNALLDLANRDVKFVAIDYDVHVELDGHLTPLILDEYQGKPVLSIGGLL